MLQKIELDSIKTDPFDAIGNQWMLVAAGNSESCNMMTASWGGLGIIWGKPAATCYIRPQRYTREFLDREEYFSLCFFDEDKRDVLQMCGSVSGRDCDKTARSGLTVMHDKAAPYFAEAKTVLICRKLYRQQMQPECFIDSEVERGNYPAKDYHIMFIGEIAECLVDK